MDCQFFYINMNKGKKVLRNKGRNLLVEMEYGKVREDRPRAFFIVGSPGAHMVIYGVGY